MMFLLKRASLLLAFLAVLLLPLAQRTAAASDDAVTFLCNPTHNAVSTTPKLGTPLTKLWSKDLGADVSYPLIAQGMVFVTTKGDTTPAGYGTRLYALNAQTGAVVWGPVSLGGTYYFGACAYEAGKLFVVNYNGLLRSFNAATGTPGWSLQLPNQYSFTAAPTALNGVVYVGGAGSGGTVYAVNEANGAVLWMQSVENGDSSSPVVTDNGVYVSYAGPQTYKFDLSGNLIWRYDSGSEGGGGATAVFYDSQLYVRAFSQYNGSYVNGFALSSDTGAILSTFGQGYNNNQKPPAFDSGLGFFADYNGNIQAQDVQSRTILWNFAIGQDGVVTPPLIVNGNVYVGTSGGRLIALDESTGQTVWSTYVGSGISAYGYDGGSASTPIALAAGDSLLVVPAGSLVVAYGVSGTDVTPATLTLSSSPTDPYTPVTATLTLSAAAPTEGTLVMLGVSDATLASVPASVTVAVGQTTATFPVTIAANLPAVNHHLTVSATAGGITLSAPLEVQPAWWKAVSIATGPDEQTRVLWNRSDGAITLWTLGADNSPTAYSSIFGPYPGWTAKAISVGPDNNTHVLWTNTDGRMTLWTLDANNQLTGSFPVFGPYAGWTAVGIATGANGDTHILWDNADGRMTPWTLDAHDQLTGSFPIYGPFDGWKATSISAGPDNNTHILWNNADGRMTPWMLDATNQLTGNTPVYGPYAGWTATSIATDLSSSTHVLWHNSDGRMTPWTLDSTNTLTGSFPVYGSYGGWSAIGISAGGSGSTHILWDNINGQMTPWTLDANNQQTGSFPIFGPY